MSLTRPVVLVFQEFANPTVTAPEPDLNCLVVGPAYYIQDYYKPGINPLVYADKANIKLATDYGALEAAPADAATPVGTGVITAADVPNNIPGAIVDAASVKVYFDQARVIIASGTQATTTNGSNSITVADGGTDLSAGDKKVLPGDRVIFTDGGGHSQWRTVLSVTGAGAFLLTADINTSGNFAPAAGQDWRIERQLLDQLVDSSFYTIVPSGAGNTVSIDGGVTLPANGGAKPVTYAKVYVSYRALRQDLQQVLKLQSQADILAILGRIDARNPLAVGAFVARQNTTSSVLAYGVQANDLLGHSLCRDTIQPRDDIYTVVPLTTDVNVIAMWNTDNVGLAQPDESKGRPQRFRVVIGSGTLPTVSTVGATSSTATTVQASGTAPSGTKLWTFPAATFLTWGAQPGWTVQVTLDANGTTRNATYTIAHVNSETVIEVDEAIAAAATANCSIKLRDTTGTDISGTVAITNAVSAARDDLYLVLKDPAGTFITSGIMAGDIVQIPTDPNGTSFAAYSSFTVASVISENRLQIVNNGNDSSAAVNELPHTGKRTGGALVTQGSITYKVVRSLNKDQQVTALVAVAQSFSSRRTVLVWPDKVDVAGVTGGTNQPGYYLSCAVGGMTAGLPSHQGFTFLGIAGIAQIYRSNTYFSDDQLTSLMQGGWYVFSQQTPQSLPFTIHQLTTDPSTLESGEFSVVKNFDYVSLFFVDILQSFLGKYNVTAETLSFLRQALNDGIDTLKLRVYARIGAPLTYGSIVDLAPSATNADRVITKLSVGLPKPLNVIELHLVA